MKKLIMLVLFLLLVVLVLSKMFCSKPTEKQVDVNCGEQRLSEVVSTAEPNTRIVVSGNCIEPEAVRITQDNLVIIGNGAEISLAGKTVEEPNGFIVEGKNIIIDNFDLHNGVAPVYVKSNGSMMGSRLKIHDSLVGIVVGTLDEDNGQSESGTSGRQVQKLGAETNRSISFDLIPSAHADNHCSDTNVCKEANRVITNGGRLELNQNICSQLILCDDGSEIYNNTGYGIYVHDGATLSNHTNLTVRNTTAIAPPQGGSAATATLDTGVDGIRVTGARVNIKSGSTTVSNNHGDGIHISNGGTVSIESKLNINNNSGTGIVCDDENEVIGGIEPTISGNGDNRPPTHCR